MRPTLRMRLTHLTRPTPQGASNRQFGPFQTGIGPLNIFSEIFLEARVHSMHPVSIDNGVALLHLDELIYNRDAVMRTCYWFTDRCYVFVSRPQDSMLLVSLRMKTVAPTLDNPRPEQLESVAGEFQNALLDQQLRIDIEQQTRLVRELLVAKAFSEAGVMDDPIPGDYRDPVGLLPSS